VCKAGYYARQGYCPTRKGVFLFCWLGCWLTFCTVKLYLTVACLKRSALITSSIIIALLMQLSVSPVCV
jgi:hypothetical protein